MNTFPATLEFKIHLLNGAVSRFTAEGEASVQDNRNEFAVGCKQLSYVV